MESVFRTYGQGQNTVTVLRSINFDVMAGEIVSLVGKSGSGKSTLLHLAGIMDYPTAGEVYIEKKVTSNLAPKQRAEIRRNSIGFVFQFFHLLPQLSVFENISLPQLMKGANNIEDRTNELLEVVGMSSHASRFPGELSGGEMQRVAVARAVANKPRLILADEPTGNLDKDSGQVVLDLLMRSARMYDSALLLVTHDSETARLCDRVITIEEGTLSAH